MEQLINILIALGGVGFFGWLLMVERSRNKGGPVDPYNSIEGKPKIKPPDLNKIKEAIKDETPQESTDHVNSLLNDLFPND